MKIVFLLLFLVSTSSIAAQPDSWQELNPAEDNGYFPYVPNAGIFYSANFDKVYLYDPIHYFLDEGYNTYMMSHYLTSFDGSNWEPLIETDDYQWGDIEYVIDFDEGFAFVQNGGTELGQYGYRVSYYNGTDIIELGEFEMQSPAIALAVEDNQLYLCGFFGVDENREFNILSYSLDTLVWTTAFSSMPEIDNGWPYSLLRFQDNWYLGGDFTNDSQNVTLMVFEGEQWEEVENENGYPTGGRIRKLAKYQDKLALAIEILGEGSIDEGIGSGVIFWDGQNWDSPQQLLWIDGTPGGVAIWDIEIQEGNLYAFGTLFGASDATFRYLAKWDGSQWCGMQTSAWELGGFEMEIYQNRIIQAGFNWGTPNRVYWHDGETFSPCTTPVSVDEEEAHDFVVYPNPATNHLNLSWSTTTTGNALVRMTTLEGKIVLEEETNASQQHTIDTSALAEGFYLLTVQMNNQWYVEKVVIRGE